MSTATGPTSAYADCDEYIEHRIRVARNRIKWTDLLTALLLAGVLLIGYVLIFTLCDHWVVAGGFAPTTRAVMLGVVILLCAVIVYRYVIRPWTKEIHPLYAARMLDNEGGPMDGALMSIVDLNESDGQATQIIRRTIEKRAAVGLSSVNIDEVIDRKWLMNLGITLFVLVLTTCAYAVFSPKSINLLRPLSLSSAAVATQTRILRIQPGDSVIQAGEELEITADIGGLIPDAVHVLYTTQDKTYVDEQLTMSETDDAGRYRVLMVGDSERGLRQNFSYQVVAGDATSALFQVTVDEPPTANVTRLSYSYPEYMEVPPKTTQNGNIDAWEGTFVAIEAESNVALRMAILRFSDDPTFAAPAEEFALSTNGKLLSGRIQLNVREDGTTPRYYKIDVTDTEGRIDPQPTVYAIKIRPDRIPLVQLIDPVRDMRVPANAIIPLLVEAEDPDFFLRSVKLEYDINGEPRTPLLLFDATRTGPAKSWAGTWDFRLEGLQLKAGDTVNYYITARDNKPPLGSQSRTGVLKLFIEAATSEERVQEQLQQDRDLQEQQLRERNAENGNRDSEAQRPDQQTSDQQPPDGEGQPMPSDDSAQSEAAKDGNDASVQEAGGSDAGGESSTGQQSDKQQPSPDGGAGQAESSGEDEPGNEGNSSPEEQSSNSNKDLSDDEALQELLEAYNQKNEESNSAEESGTDSIMDDSQTPAERESDDSTADGDAMAEPETDKNATTPEGTLPEKSADGMGDKSESADANNDSSEMSNGSEGTESQPTDGDEDVQQPSGDKTQPGSDGESEKQTGQQSMPEDNNGSKSTDQNASDAESDKQAGEPDKQAGESDKQAGESDKQAGESDKQGGESDKQGAESDKQAGESDKQGGESDKQAGESDKQGGESDKQGGESDKQGGESDKQGGESDKQAGESGKEGGESGKEGGESGKEGGESGKEGGESGKEGGESGKEGGESGKEGGESGKEGGESGKEGGESGKEGGESGKEGGESGKEGGESGKEGGESGKEGGESGKQGGESGKEGGKGGAAPDGESGGEGSTHGKGSKSQPGGTGSGGSNPAGGVGSKGGGGDSAGGPEPGEGGGSKDGSSNGNFETDDANVDDAAQAADLVLKRIQKDLDRGKVDKELLEKLGWTEDQLKSFSDRMQKQLDTLKDPADQSTKAKQLQRRRVEELLKGLDLKSKSSGKIGDSKRNREQQDTTSRQAPVPTRYKDLMKLYEQSLSKGVNK